jgi:hypothetical protein
MGVQQQRLSGGASLLPAEKMKLRRTWLARLARLERGCELVALASATRCGLPQRVLAAV